MVDRFQTFTILINKISGSIRKIKMQEMEKLGLKSTHVSCLYYLFTSGGLLTATKLCEMCGEDKAAVSRSIEFLEKDGYLTCKSKSQKRYNSPLSLTEKGTEIGKFVADKIDKLLNEASAGLEEAERKSMYNSLELINKNLTKIIESEEGM